MQSNTIMKTKQMPDKSLLSAILLMIVFGWIMSFSASLAYFESYSYFFKQTLFIFSAQKYKYIFFFAFNILFLFQKEFLFFDRP